MSWLRGSRVVVVRHEVAEMTPGFYNPSTSQSDQWSTSFSGSEVPRPLSKSPGSLLDNSPEPHPLVYLCLVVGPDSKPLTVKDKGSPGPIVNGVWRPGEDEGTS